MFCFVFTSGGEIEEKKKAAHACFSPIRKKLEACETPSSGKMHMAAGGCCGNRSSDSKVAPAQQPVLVSTSVHPRASASWGNSEWTPTAPSLPAYLYRTILVSKIVYITTDNYCDYRVPTPLETTNSRRHRKVYTKTRIIFVFTFIDDSISVNVTSTAVGVRCSLSDTRRKLP